MNLRNLAAAVVATSLTAVPAFAQAVERAAAPVVADASELGRGGPGTLLLLIAVVLMGAGIYFLVDNNKNKPNSP